MSKKKKYCIVHSNGSYVAHPSGDGLGWTSDLNDALDLAQSLGAQVYDAEAFAKDPVVAKHSPVGTNDELRNKENEGE